MQESLFEIFIFLAAACAVIPIASRFRVGSVLGYLIVGVIIGPFVLGLITDAQKVMHFAEFGVVMMLFLIGLELEPAMLWRIRKAIIGLGGLQVLLTSIVFTLVGVALGYSWQASMAIAMALALSSTALVLQLLNEKKLMNTSVGENSFAVLLFQDIAVIPILILLPILAVNIGFEGGLNQSNNIISDLPSYAQAIVIACVIASLIIGGRYVSSHLFRVIAKTNMREIFTALSLALVIGVTLLMQSIGISPALGAFVAGVVLANSEYRRTIEADIEPFKGLLLGLFFISVGMGVDFLLLADSLWMILSAVGALIAIKVLILIIIGFMFRMTLMHNIGYAIALSQGGEFAFVLFQYAGGLSILAQDQVRFLTLVVALSIATTPILMMLYSRFIVPRFMSVLSERSFDSIEEQNPIIIAGFGRFGQVIGRFLVAQGVKVTVLEKDPDQIELLRKFGFKGYFGDATRMDLLRSAGIDKSKAIIIAVDDVETSLEIAKMVRDEFPSVTIFARARNRQHAFELNKIGVNFYKREMFDSSLNMAKEVMLWLGVEKSDLTNKAETFLRHDEQTLKDSFDFFNDERALISFAKTRRSELEQILKSDKITNIGKNNNGSNKTN